MKAVSQMDQEPEDETDVLVLTEVVAPPVRRLGLFNSRGLWTLTMKEINRFLKIPGQTLVSPLVMTLLFYAVFLLGVPGHTIIGTVSFLDFILPGLIMMAIAQSAFVNTAISLLLSKIQGNIVDILMAPVSPLELTIGYAIGGVVRGVLVGLVSFTVLYLIAPIHIHSIFYVLYFGLMGSLMLSLIGLITGIWGDKFDHMGTIQNFIIMPATFLSGTFFTVSSLPEKWRIVCLANPFFYMIDGFRYGFTGVSDASLWMGIGLLFIINMGLFNVAYWMFANGTFLKK